MTNNEQVRSFGVTPHKNCLLHDGTLKILKLVKVEAVRYWRE